jgi:hypothetical protein
MWKTWLRWFARVVVVILVLFTALFIYFGFQPPAGPSADAMAVHNAYFATNPSFNEVSIYMEELAFQHGGVYAFDVLKYGTLPPNMDTHLIGHYVGDVLYQQEGINGMRYCDEAVGYACAHSVVINALLRDGPGVFEVINDVCASIGLPGSYDMCFHGFGHGVLAYAEYDLPAAIELCERVGTEAYDYYEVEECLGGVVMEMRGGIHNPIVWAEKQADYLDPSNPLAMCEASYMPVYVRDMCYIYITPFIFDAVSSADIPPPRVFADAMAWCAVVRNADEREHCYAGFGKEYVGFVLGRDIRYLNEISPAQASQVHQWCAATEDAVGVTACVEVAAYSVYRSGSIGYTGAYTFCGQSRSVATANRCFESLFRSAANFHSETEYLEAFCAAAPPGRDEQCLATVFPPA